MSVRKARVYLASKYETHPLMREWAKQLEDSGLFVTSRWIAGDHDYRNASHKAMYCRIDLQDVKEADIVIFNNDLQYNMRGAYIEFGYALALGKRIVIIGKLDLDSSVFFYNPQVASLPTFEAALNFLSKLYLPAEDKLGGLGKSDGIH